MTSKEAIKIARNVFQFENGEETDEWSRSVIKGLEQAEKDLEVLEIIRKNMMILPYHNKNKKYESIALCMTFVGEDVEKIKELLK